MYARQDTVLYHNNVHAADVSWFQGILAVFDGIFVLWTSLDIFGQFHFQVQLGLFSEAYGLS